MRSLLLLALALTACGPGDAGHVAGAAPASLRPPDAPPDTAFDARAWLRAWTAALDAATAAQPDYAAALALSKRFALELNAGAPWLDACGMSAESLSDVESPLGSLTRYPLGEDEHLVGVTCESGGYQGSTVLVHLQGARAVLVPAPQFNDRGEVAETTALYFGLLDVDPGRRAFGLYTKSRGMGGCGALARYRLGDEPGAVDVVEVRAQTCDAEASDERLDPEDWPVVYPRG